MNYLDLDQEEREILDAYEKGEYIPVDDFEEAKRESMLAAKNTLNKTRNINIRLMQGDINKLKAKAIEEGIPYQTLAASILHKTVSK